MFPGFRWLAGAMVLLGAGCLPDPLPVDGRALYTARTIERPAFLNVDGKPYVQFETLASYPSGDKTGSSDLWMVGWDEGGPSVLLMANKSDRWPIEVDSARLRYIMHD